MVSLPLPPIRVYIDDNGNFTYIANKGYKGSDSIIIEVSDKESSNTKELKFSMKGYEYNGGDLEISLIDTTLKLPNLNNDLVLSLNSGDRLFYKRCKNNQLFNL